MALAAIDTDASGLPHQYPTGTVDQRSVNVVKQIVDLRNAGTQITVHVAARRLVRVLCGQIGVSCKMKIGGVVTHRPEESERIP
jgi:hypothetical protein